MFRVFCGCIFLVDCQPDICRWHALEGHPCPLSWNQKRRTPLQVSRASGRSGNAGEATLPGASAEDMKKSEPPRHDATACTRGPRDRRSLPRDWPRNRAHIAERRPSRTAKMRRQWPPSSSSRICPKISRDSTSNRNGGMYRQQRFQPGRRRTPASGRCAPHAKHQLALTLPHLAPPPHHADKGRPPQFSVVVSR